jgi:hypothetical protein
MPLDTRDEQGRSVPLLTRAENSQLTQAAVMRAAADLVGQGTGGELSEQMRTLFSELADGAPRRANVALAQIHHAQGFARPEHVPQANWESFLEVLGLLMEHSVLWTPIYGLPGESRVLKISHDYQLRPKPVLRRRIKREVEAVHQAEQWVPAVTHRPLRGPSFSLTAFVERAGEMFGWMPVELFHPTNYAKRATTYHFQLQLPSGLSPRAIRIGRQEGPTQSAPVERRGALGERSAHLYIDRPIRDDIKVVVAFGIGAGVLPGLWAMATFLTAALIWLFAFHNPDFSRGELQIGGGVLMIVPALLAGFVFALDTRSGSRLLSGARWLVLVAALAAVGAATVLIDALPFSFDPQKAWVMYAFIATFASALLTVAWALSKPFAWTNLKRLDSPADHFVASATLAAVSIAGLLALGLTDAGELARSLAAASLFALAVVAFLAGVDRTTVDLEDRRGIAPLLDFLVGTVCVAAGTYEIARMTEAAGADDLELVGVLIIAFGAIAALGWHVLARLLRPLFADAWVMRASADEAQEIIRGERIDRQLYRFQNQLGRFRLGGSKCRPNED